MESGTYRGTLSPCPPSTPGDLPALTSGGCTHTTATSTSSWNQFTPAEHLPVRKHRFPSHTQLVAAAQSPQTKGVSHGPAGAFAELSRRGPGGLSCAQRDVSPCSAPLPFLPQLKALQFVSLKQVSKCSAVPDG